MNKLLLNVTPEPRKQSRINMDNVFNLLLRLVSSESFGSVTTFTSVLSLTYNRIQVLYNEDPALCLSTLKLYQKWFVEYERGSICPNPGVRAWMWDSTRDMPIMLVDILDYIDGPAEHDINHMIFIKRVTFALLGLHRVMIHKGNPSYKTITSAGKEVDKSSQYYPSKFDSIFANLGFSADAFKRRYRHECESFKYTILSSAGVNGDATWTAHSDAKCWALNPTLLEHFHSFAKGSDLLNIFEDLIQCVKIKELDNVEDNKLVLGRLHSFEEWGGKIRTVAIVDYWTQMLMTPLHNTINYFLKSLEMDGTFNQDAMSRRVLSWTASRDNIINSFDLSAATDTLPVSLQVDILGHLLGSVELAEAWCKVLTERDYHTADGKIKRYARGQPMGARSSFAMLALTHHVIVQYALIKANSPKFTQYCVLGDDMTIMGSDEARIYKSIMGILGVPINESKSIIHMDKPVVPAAEICKRVFIDGWEISTIPVKLLAKLARDSKLAPEVQNEFGRKGFKWTSDMLTRFFFGVTDKEGFNELLLYNSLPASVSAVTDPVNIPGFKFSKPNAWFADKVESGKCRLDGIFTYTAAVENLKRLDALLRNTLAIGSAISKTFDLYSNSPVNIETMWEILGIPTAVPENIVKLLRKDIEELSPNHPIIKASENEITRITELLSGLISHDTNMHRRAQSGLLDLLRNSLTDVWIDTESARAQMNRTLLTKTISNLDDALFRAENGTDRDGNIVFDLNLLRLDYTIMLSTIERMWSIRWDLDNQVTVNAVKSRISPSVSNLDTAISAAMDSVVLRKDRPGKKSRV